VKDFVTGKKGHSFHCATGVRHHQCSALRAVSKREHAACVAEFMSQSRPQIDDRSTRRKPRQSAATIECRVNVDIMHQFLDLQARRERIFNWKELSLSLFLESKSMNILIPDRLQNNVRFLLRVFLQRNAAVIFTKISNGIGSTREYISNTCSKL
jgi:hypothetical protein